MRWAIFGILFVIDMVFAALYIKFGLPKVTKKSYVYKMIASGTFVINGLIAFLCYNNSVFSKWVLLGLVFGWLGDIIIALEPFIKDDEKKKKRNTIAVTAGGVLFFFGHVLYIIAFIKELIITKSFNPVLYGCIVGFAIGGALTFLLFKIRMGKFTVPIIIYAIAITSMFALSTNVAITNTNGNIFFKIALIIAPLFFVISDTTIVLRFFNKEKYEIYPIRIVNLGTYFIAQMLFGLAIYLK